MVVVCDTVAVRVTAEVGVFFCARLVVAVVERIVEDTDGVADGVVAKVAGTWVSVARTVGVVVCVAVAAGELC